MSTATLLPALVPNPVHALIALDAAAIALAGQVAACSAGAWRYTA